MRRLQLETARHQIRSFSTL